MDVIYPGSPLYIYQVRHANAHRHTHTCTHTQQTHTHILVNTHTHMHTDPFIVLGAVACDLIGVATQAPELELETKETTSPV